MGFRDIEGRPTPQEAYNRRLYSEALVIATGSLLYVIPGYFGREIDRCRLRFGYDSAFVGTTVARDSLLADSNITKYNSSAISSNITSIFQAGAFFGALFSFFRMPLHCVFSLTNVTCSPSIVTQIDMILCVIPSHFLPFFTNYLFSGYNRQGIVGYPILGLQRYSSRRTSSSYRQSCSSRAL
jgi:hypothetical protein